MLDYSKRKQEHKRNLSDWIIDYDKKNYDNLKNNDENHILLDNFKECSNLRKSIHNNIKNIDLGFSNSKINQKNDNSFSLDNDINDRNKNYYLNEEIEIKKDNISHFGNNNKIFDINDNLNKNQISNKNITIASLRKKFIPNEIIDDKNNEQILENNYKLKKIKHCKNGNNNIINNNGNKDRIVKYIEVEKKIINNSQNLNKIKNFGKNKYSDQSKDKILNSIFTEIENVNGKKDDEEDLGIEDQEEEDYYQKNFKLNRIKKEIRQKKPKYENIEKDISIKISNPNNENCYYTNKKYDITDKNSNTYYENKNYVDKEENGNRKLFFSGGRNITERSQRYKKYYKENNLFNATNKEKEKIYNEIGDELTPIKSPKYYRELNKNKTTNEIIFRKKNNLNEGFEKKEEKRSYRGGNVYDTTDNDFEKENNKINNINNKQNKIILFSSKYDKKKDTFKDIENERKENNDLLNIKKEKPINIKQNFNFEISIDINEDKRKKKTKNEIEKEIISSNKKYNTKKYFYTDGNTEESKEDEKGNKGVNILIKKYENRDLTHSNENSEELEEEYRAKEKYEKIKTEKNNEEIDKNLNTNKSVINYKIKKIYDIDENKDDKIFYSYKKKPEKRRIMRRKYLTYEKSSEEYEDENRKNRLINQSPNDKSYITLRKGKSNIEEDKEENIEKYNNDKYESPKKQEKNIYDMYEKELMNSNKKSKLKLFVNRINYNGKIIENINYRQKEKNDKEEREKERERLRLEIKKQYENERIEKEKRERERIEKERREKEKKERQKIEREKREKERKEREEKERREKEERERKEREIFEKERLERLELERLEREEKERKKKEKLEKERLNKIERDIKIRLERELQEKLDNERKEILEREKQERIERKKREKEKERLEQERQERVRIENEKKENERLERERKEKERLEKERILLKKEQIKLERERIEIEQQKERLKREEIEERDKAEKENLKREYLLKDRLAKEK